MKAFQMAPDVAASYQALLAMVQSLPLYVQQTYNAGGGYAPAIPGLPQNPDPEQAAFVAVMLVPLRVKLVAFFQLYAGPLGSASGGPVV